MTVRRDTNPRPLALPPELQGILHRNGMSALVVGSSNGFALVVQGHDSPVLTYPITEKQLRLLTDWGSNSANRKAYNTFASIVAADFDMPKDFVHARNANGRVAMGLHGYRIGVGEYGRMPGHHYHMMGPGFLGWTPRQQEGWHMRRIGHDLYYPGAPMVPTRPDGRMKPGELAAGGFLEGKNGREVMVGDIRVEPTETEGKYKMSAVIDGKEYSHEITQKQYDKFLTVDDYNRMKLFAKVFNEVDIKKLPSEGEGSGRNVGAHILAALTAGLVVGDEVLHHRHHPRPEFYGQSVYYKPGVDTPQDVATREFDAMMNQPRNTPQRGL